MKQANYVILFLLAPVRINAPVNWRTRSRTPVRTADHYDTVLREYKVRSYESWRENILYNSSEKPADALRWCLLMAVGA
jgi:hypothetical protein